MKKPFPRPTVSAKPVETRVPETKEDVVQLSAAETEALQQIDNSIGQAKISIAHMAMEIDRLQAEQKVQIQKARELTDLYMGKMKAAARANGIDPDAGPDGPKWAFDGLKCTFTRQTP